MIQKEQILTPNNDLFIVKPWFLPKFSKVKTQIKKLKKVYKLLKPTKKFNLKQINLKKKVHAKRRNIFWKYRSKSDLLDSNKYKHRLSIILKANNIFCVYGEIKGKRTTISSSWGGKRKLQLSKKNIRFEFSNVLTPFLFKIRRKQKIVEKQLTIAKEKHNFKLKKNKYKNRKNKYKHRMKLKKISFLKKDLGLLINIIAPPRQRKVILRTLQYALPKTRLRAPIIKFVEKKIFNGCRAPKKQRKKRRRMRVLK